MVARKTVAGHRWDDVEGMLMTLQRPLYAYSTNMPKVVGSTSDKTASFLIDSSIFPLVIMTPRGSEMLLSAEVWTSNRSRSSPIKKVKTPSFMILFFKDCQ